MLKFRLSSIVDCRDICRK